MTSTNVRPQIHRLRVAGNDVVALVGGPLHEPGVELYTDRLRRGNLRDHRVHPIGSADARSGADVEHPPVFHVRPHASKALRELPDFQSGCSRCPVSDTRTSVATIGWIAFGRVGRVGWRIGHDGQTLSGCSSALVRDDRGHRLQRVHLGTEHAGPSLAYATLTNQSAPRPVGPGPAWLSVDTGDGGGFSCGIRETARSAGAGA